MAREFSKVGVIGLGTMGAGIVEVFARNGIDVVAMEVDDAAVEKGRGVLEHSTGRAVSRGKLTEQDQAALHARVHFTSSMDDLADCQLVVEAVPEQLDAQEGDLRQARCHRRPGRDPRHQHLVARRYRDRRGHRQPQAGRRHALLQPGPGAQFVEVIRTVVTEDEVFEDVKALAERLGKQPVIVGDKAGFIANAAAVRLPQPRGVDVRERGYATREDIDAAMRLGCGYPMGPLALIDLIGLDTAYEILDTMYKQGRDRLHAPTPIIKQMVSAGSRAARAGGASTPTPSPVASQVVDDALTPKPAVGHEAGWAAAGRHGRRRRLRHDGHWHHRGLRQGGLRRPLRDARPGKVAAVAAELP